jgi:hypothetical protein
MKHLFTILLLSSSLSAVASQIVYDGNEKPVCYTGDPKSALEEVLALDYDPVLEGKIVTSRGRFPKKNLRVKQYDENGWILQEFFIVPCAN